MIFCEFLTSRDFLVQPLNLQNYHEFEALKYKMFSTCSTLGYYISRKSCILKHRIHGSLGGSKVGPESPERVRNSLLGSAGPVVPVPGPVLALVLAPAPAPALVPGSRAKESREPSVRWRSAMSRESPHSQWPPVGHLSTSQGHSKDPLVP